MSLFLVTQAALRPRLWSYSYEARTVSARRVLSLIGIDAGGQTITVTRCSYSRQQIWLETSVAGVIARSAAK
jgi:hypothetical protein